MTRLLRLATLPVLAVLTLAASPSQALPMSLDRFRVATEDTRPSTSNARSKPTTATAKPATAMACTTQQTTSKAGFFRKKVTKTTKVCTPAKTVPAAVPAGQAPPVESFASVDVPAVVAPPAPPVSSAAPPASPPSPPRPRPAPAPAPGGNAGGNSTTVGSNSYVSPVIEAPSLFAPASTELPPVVPVVSLAPVAEVPEPATLALLGLGLLGLGVARRRVK